MGKVSVNVATGIPTTFTRALVDMVETMPPCGHDAEAPTWKRGPGTGITRLSDYERSLVDRRRWANQSD